MRDIELGNLNPDRFEDLCINLLREEIENGNIHSIDGGGGDDGIDGFKGEINGEITIYQQKYYTGRLSDTSSRKSNIISSFQTAKEEHPELQKWVLMIALDFTPGEQEWFEENIKEESGEIEIDYWEKSKIENSVSKYRGIVDRFFPETIMSQQQRQRDLLNYIDGSVVDQTGILFKKLEETEQANSELNMEIKYDSENNTQKISLNPERNVEIHTDLAMSEGELEKINQGEKVKFQNNQIKNIDFDPDILPELEPDELIMKPWHHDWERDVQIEIPTGSCKKELTLVINDVSDEGIEIGTQNPVFNLTLSYSPDMDEINFHIDPELFDQPVHEISELMNFIHELDAHERLLIRNVEDGEPIISGEIESSDGIEDQEEGWLEQHINDLSLIEAHSGKSFTLKKGLDESEEVDIAVAADLLREGNSICPYNFNGEFTEGNPEEVLRIDDDIEGLVELHIEGFWITVLGEKIQIGDVEFRMPNPDLANADEIRDKIDQSDTFNIEIRPSEEARIELVE